MKGFAPWSDERLAKYRYNRQRRIILNRPRLIAGFIREKIVEARAKNIAARSDAILKGTVKPNRFGLVTINGVVMRAKPVAKLSKSAQREIRKRRRP